MKRLSKLLKRHRRRPRPQSAGVYGPQCLEDRSLMASIHANLDGDVLVTFSAIGESGSQDVFARLQTEDGTTEQQVNVTTAGIQGNETAALGEDERFVVVWSGRGKGDGHGIFARVFFPDGTRSDEILVAEDVSGEQESPAVAMDAAGRFVVAWSGPGAGDSHGIFIRAFEANGTPRGDAVLVNANAALLQRGPSIDMNAAGQLLVAWESLGEDGNGWGVQAQRFDATIQPQGSAIKINTTTEHQQLGAEAALADDGSAVVAFASQLPGNLWEVRERSIDTNGVPAGADVPVTTAALGGKPQLDVINSGADRHVVTWAWGTRSGDGAGIFGRSIADGQPEDVPFMVSDATGANLVPSVAVDPQGDLLFAWSGRGGEPVSTATREADRDRTLPGLTATLASPVATDGTVGQVTLDVGLTDVNPVTRLQVRLDGQAFKDLLTGANLRDDDFEISAAQLAAALGAAIPGGQHTLGLQAQDEDGNLSAIVNVQFTLDLPPVIVAALAVDNGLSNTDRITTLPTISGNITDVGAVTKLQASIDSLTLQDINTSTTDHRGSFTITQALLETLLGGPIADGDHTVRVQATDVGGKVSEVVLVNFTLDRAAPTLNQPLADLSFFEDDPSFPFNMSEKFTGQGLVFSVQQNTNPNLLRTEVQGSNIVLDFLENRVGSVQLTVRATKPNGLFVDDTFTVDVLANPDAPTVIHQLENLVLPNVNGQLTSLNLGGVFGDADELGTLVRFDLANGMGSVGLELFNGATPQTVQNFISYINSGRYANSIVHRTAPGFIIQGGGYVFEGTNNFSEVDRQAAVTNEPGISNRRGTIAMAKVGGQANSATSEFFFNLDDNNNLAIPQSLDNANGGFTAFGRVLGNGMTLIDSLANLEIRDLRTRTDIMGTKSNGAPIRGVFGESEPGAGDGIPLNTTYTDLDFAMQAPVTAEDVVRFTNIVLDPTLTGGKGGDSSVTITASSSSTSVVLVTVNNKRLTLDPVANGTSTITVTATDSTNSTITQTFTVTVVRPDTGMVSTIPSLNAPEWQTVRQVSDGTLRIWDVVRGTGELVDPGAAIDVGDRVSVHYTGWLASNGNQFDSSRSNVQPVTFSLSNLIQGWKEAIPGMREGGIRRLDIPASLAYGAAGSPPSIPGNARLVFEIKLLDVPSLTPLMLAGGEETAVPTFDEIASYNPRPLSPEMQELVLAAIDRLSATGLERQVASSLGNVSVQMADLPGSLLGLALADQIWLDADAAGQGWFFDSSPADDLEFIAGIASSSAAAGRIDLLSVAAHELGHVLGLPDLDVGDSLMFEALGPGMRRVLDVSHP